MKTATANKITALVVEHVSASFDPLVLRQLPGSHEGYADDSLVLWREDGTYNTGHDYWTAAASENDRLRSDLARLGYGLDAVHAESVVVYPL